MIKVNVLLKEQQIEKVSLSGHSGYAVHGQDIVCAAVSSIVTTSINGILSINQTISFTDDGNTLEITVLKHDEVTDKLLSTMIQLLESIEKQYKKNLSIRTEEKK